MVRLTVGSHVRHGRQVVGLQERHPVTPPSCRPGDASRVAELPFDDPPTTQMGSEANGERPGDTEPG